MRSRAILVAFLSLTICAIESEAQFWEKKDWKQWSKGDAQKMLEDSPWVKKWTMGEVREVQFGQPTQGTGREDRPQMYYILQLRSALPVRQAVIRQAQTSPQFSKLPEDQKKAFEVQGQAFVDKTYDDVIVVHVVFGCNVQVVERNMMRLWQSFAADEVPAKTYLISSNGKRVPPVKIISPPGGGTEFELIFPRNVGNEPIVTPADKAIRIEFPTPDLTALGAGGDTKLDATTPRVLEDDNTRTRVFAEFKLEKMKYSGKLEF